MVILKRLMRILTVFVFLLASLFSLPVIALVDSETRLDDATCLSCHDDSQEAIQVPDVIEEGEMRELLALEKKSLKLLKESSSLRIIDSLYLKFVSELRIFIVTIFYSNNKPHLRTIK